MLWPPCERRATPCGRPYISSIRVYMAHRHGTSDERPEIELFLCTGWALRNPRIQTRNAHRQMPRRLPLAKNCAYGSIQGRARIFIGDKVRAKLRKGQQIIWIAHRYSDHAPSQRYEVAHNFRLSLVQVCVHGRYNENIRFTGGL